MNSNFQIREDHLISKDLIKDIICKKLPPVRFEPSLKEPFPIEANKPDGTTGKELLLHKRIGNFQFFSDCETSFQRDKTLEIKDEMLETKLPSIINYFKRKAYLKKQAAAAEDFEQKKKLMIQSYKVGNRKLDQKFFIGETLRYIKFYR